ncbi:MAG TPA: aminopeptidase, partial [Cyclobacteriaceae bacterium]|nr:aminopeptidase [Cyclobacteriaceae bacterium]
GTSLTYKVAFKANKTHIQSPYLDNRLGIYNALKIAEELRDGVICFSCWEEHGGGSVPYLARFIYQQWKIKQALISDITWATDGVELGKGVVISMRDRNIPRRGFVNKIIEIAKRNKVDFQLEVEGIGSSDGRELQTSPYPFDWCFIGAPQQNPHTPTERAHQYDVTRMIALYKVLMKEL